MFDLICLVLFVIFCAAVSNASKKQQKQHTGSQARRPSAAAEDNSPRVSSAERVETVSMEGADLPGHDHGGHAHPFDDAAPAAAARPVKHSFSAEGMATEGFEPEDHDHGGLLMPEETDEAAEAAPSGLKLSFSGSHLVNAFVLQEVLKRPCERRRRS